MPQGIKIKTKTADDRRFFPKRSGLGVWGLTNYITRVTSCLKNTISLFVRLDWITPIITDVSFSRCTCEFLDTKHSFYTTKSREGHGGVVSRQADQSEVCVRRGHLPQPNYLSFTWPMADIPPSITTCPKSANHPVLIIHRPCAAVHANACFHKLTGLWLV